MKPGIYLKPGSTLRGQAVRWNGIFSNWFFRLIYILSNLVGFAMLAIIIASFTKYQLNINISFAYFLLTIAVAFIVFKSFISGILEKEYLPLSEVAELAAKKPVNLFAAFSPSLAAATDSLFTWKKIENINLKSLATAITKDTDLNFLLNRLGLSEESLTDVLANHEDQSLAFPFLLEACQMAVNNQHKLIQGGDVLLALFEKDPPFVALLESLQINLDDIKNVVYWLNHIKGKIAEDKLFTTKLRLTGGVGRDWAFGYTPYLKNFSRDITQSIRDYGMGLELVGREKEILEIIEALSKQSGGNAIVVGDAGIGKHTVVMGFAKAVLEGKTSGYIAHKHVFQVDTDTLLAGASDPGELAARLSRILSEASYAGNIIIFIENIDNILSAGGAGQADLSEVLLPFLDNSGIHIIGTSEVAGYNNLILVNTALSSRFNKITLVEPDEKAMTLILEETVASLESQSGVLISYEAIKDTLKAADKHFMNQPNPEKSINLIEAVATKVASERGATIILPQDVEAYLSEKMNLPTGEVNEKEKETLLNLETLLHKYVIGQEEAMKAIANALRRSRSQISDSRKPIGSFLFLGPTGVGKTATAKALAEVYFGGEDHIVRFDMSEYQNKDDIYRLIGQRGQKEQGNLVTAMNEKPFALVLFDEVEKAHPDILNLFLQILDEGFLSDSNGRKVSFTDSIIIVTSNAGAKVIRDSVRNGQDFEKNRAILIDYIVNNNIFRPEFINRFTQVISFSPLSEDQIVEVAKKMIEGLEKSVLQNKDIKLTVDPDALAVLAKAGFDPEMGARPMERTIQEKIENLLAQKILTGELKKGDSFTITSTIVQ